MHLQPCFADVLRITLRPVVLQLWHQAESAGDDRHAALSVRNWRAARAYGQIKIAKVQRAVFLAPAYFKAKIHEVRGVPHISVMCRITRRSLHLPPGVKLDIPIRQPRTPRRAPQSHRLSHLMTLKTYL